MEVLTRTFEEELREKMIQAKKECKYNPTRFNQMLPVSPRKNAHSSFHFWLLLIARAPFWIPCEVPVYSFAARISPP